MWSRGRASFSLGFGSNPITAVEPKQSHINRKHRKSLVRLLNKLIVKSYRLHSVQMCATGWVWWRTHLISTQERQAGRSLVFVLLRQGPLCRPGWPHTCNNPPVSARITGMNRHSDSFFFSHEFPTEKPFIIYVFF